jgi:hypothetical protein
MHATTLKQGDRQFAIDRVIVDYQNFFHALYIS